MNARFVAMLLLVLAVVGCKDVTVDKPLGEKPARLMAEEWDGTWVTGNGAMTFKVTDGAGGNFRVAWVEDKDGEFHLETRDIFARTVNRSLFLTMVDIPEPGRTNLHWARALMGADELKVWPPMFDEVKGLVEQGKLTGTVTSNRVSLRNLSTEHLNRIEKQTDGKLFDPESPITLRRLKSN